MSLIEDYRKIGATIKDIYDIKVHRISPHYLRSMPSKMPFGALGWANASDYSEIAMSDISTGHIFECGIFANDELELLTNLDLLDLLNDTLAIDLFKLGSIVRLDNDMGVEMVTG